MRHVRKPGDDRDARERIDVPRHAAEDRARPRRIEPDRPHGDDVTEGEHHRRDEHGNEHQDFDGALRRQIGSGEQKRERSAQRQRDQHHAGRDHERIRECRPKIRVLENERVGVETEMLRGIEERRVEEALPEDEPERHEDHDCGDHDHGGAREAEAAGDHVVSGSGNVGVIPASRFRGSRVAGVQCCSDHARDFRSRRCEFIRTPPRMMPRPNEFGPTSYFRPSVVCHCFRNSSRLV